MAATLHPRDNNSMETEYKTPPEKFAAFLKRQRMVFIVAFLQEAVRGQDGGAGRQRRIGAGAT